MSDIKVNALAVLRMEEVEDEKDTQRKDVVKTETDNKEQTACSDNESSTTGTTGTDLLQPATENDFDKPQPASSKPLKSILKKRKHQESCDRTIAIEKDKDNINDSAEDAFIDKPKFVGGSIAEALRKIKEATSKKDSPNCEDFKQENNNEPKPSAFILEMEKQKNKLPVLNSGFAFIPNVGVGAEDMDWEEIGGGKSNGSVVKPKNKVNQNHDPPYMISKPPELIRPEEKVTKKALDSSAQGDDYMESVVELGNIPFKVTNQELVWILGVWPKGGYNGVCIITDKVGLPQGYAYVILDRHSDMMNVLRMTGLEMQGRKLKVTKSCRQHLIDDWIITKKAKAMIHHSRVIKVSNLGYHLRKSELIDGINRVNFSNEDIYWKALKSGQTNSGRGFVVLTSSEDARSVSGQKFVAHGRKIDVTQVHPVEMKKFLDQCGLEVAEHHVLNDYFDERDYENCDDLLLGPEVQESEIVAVDNSSNFVVVDEAGKSAVAKKKKGNERMNRGRKDKKGKGRNVFLVREPAKKRELPPHPQRHNLPPFQPTVFIRMYDVPDKATTADVRTFFEPILPAKIAQNIGYDIYDIEFYNPGDAMESMKKHLLLLRKNTIKLEMLPGPPRPLLPPRHGPPPQSRPSSEKPIGMDYTLIPPHIMQPGPHGLNQPSIHPGRVLEPLPPGLGPVHMPPMGSQLFPPNPFNMGMGLLPPHQNMPLKLEPMRPNPAHSMIIGPSSNHVIPPGVNILANRAIDPELMPEPMSKRDLKGKEKMLSDTEKEELPEPQKELIPVPPLPKDFSKYQVPTFNKDTPVGQGVITPMQGFFCQLCNKFYSSMNSAKIVHCKSKGHYDRLKQFLLEKKRLRKLAESEVKAS